MREPQSKSNDTREGTGSSSLPVGSLSGARMPDGGVDFRALREAISIGEVLDLVGWEAVSRSGQQLRGPCPIHKSASPRSRSFSVNLEKHAFQCFGCGAKGNQLDLWVAISGLSIREAAVDLLQRLRLDSSPGE